MYQIYLSCIATVLTVVVLFCFNLPILQTKNSAGQPSGNPNYILISLVALVVGMIVAYSVGGNDNPWDLPLPPSPNY